MICLFINNENENKKQQKRIIHVSCMYIYELRTHKFDITFHVYIAGLFLFSVLPGFISILNSIAWCFRCYFSVLFCLLSILLETLYSAINPIKKTGLICVHARLMWKF